MTRRLPLFLVTAASALLVAMPAAARELVLTDAPGSRWIVDGSQGQCRMTRDFGEGEDRVTLLVTQWAPGDSFSMVLAGRPLRRFAEQQDTSLQFGDPAGPLGERRAFLDKGSLGENGDAAIFRSVTLALPRPPDAAYTDLPPEYGTAAPMLPPAAIAQADRIDLVQGRKHVRLRPSRLADALAVLDGCSVDRLNEWGLDEAAHRTLARAPYPVGLDMTDIARKMQAAYPKAAIRRGEQTSLHLRVLVDDAGTGTECSVVDMTSSSIMADPCADFMTPGAFSPALDATGRAIKSFYTAAIVFHLDSGRSR